VTLAARLPPHLLAQAPGATRQGFVVYTKDNNVAAVAGVGLFFVAAAPPAVQTRRSYCVSSRRRRSPQPTYPRLLAAAVFPLLKLSTAEMV
jgi:hypothetical protein